jgi:hypothetical protein
LARDLAEGKAPAWLQPIGGATDQSYAFYRIVPND